jgi:thioredoxin-related protein
MTSVTLLLLAAGCAPSSVPETPRIEKSQTAAPAGEQDSVPADATAAPAAEVAATPTPTPAAAKKVRKPIYDETADARADIQAAVRRAAYGHKRVLVKFGGNWCGWCFKLHDMFHEEPEIARIIHDEYELVLVDSNSNRELMEQLEPRYASFGYPWLAVLDYGGALLTTQETGVLETGPKHDVDKVKPFLLKWVAPQVDAEEVLAAALQEARAQKKRVFVHLETPLCGWCRVLDRFLDEHREILEPDYIDVPIDVVRMKSGEALQQRLRSGGSAGGVPWSAILDADGTTLVTSDGPSGNIGYPYEPAEIEHFVAMLKQTRRTLTDTTIAALAGDLSAYAETRKARQKTE